MYVFALFSYYLVPFQGLLCICVSNGFLSFLFIPRYVDDAFPGLALMCFISKVQVEKVSKKDPKNISCVSLSVCV